VGFHLKIKKEGDLSGSFALDVEGGHDIEFESTSIGHLWIFTDWAHAAGQGELADGTVVDWALTVVDGDLSTPEGADFFRVKLTAAGQVLYDTQPGAGSFARPTLGIDKGKFKIKPG
jgi:hypothetical protein